MRVLALDAALGPCSAALVVGGVTLAQRSSADMRGASAALPGLAAAVLAEAGGFDVVAVTAGPGSFTGIRAALGLAHGLALGAGTPVMAVTTMAALAAAWQPVEGIMLWVALHARSGSVFLGRRGLIDSVALDALPRLDGPVALAGNAAAAIVTRIGGVLTGIVGVEAQYVARAAAEPVNRVDAQPLYVDPPEARPAPVRRPAPV